MRTQYFIIQEAKPEIPVRAKIFASAPCPIGGISSPFLQGIEASLWLWASMAIIGIAAVRSWMGGNEEQRPGK